MSEFNDAPKGKGVLWIGQDTYGNVMDFDGTQPYYTYQGIGSLTGGSTRTNVTHNGIQVSYNGVSVLHTG